jgi:hypothetical protein
MAEISFADKAGAADAVSVAGAAGVCPHPPPAPKQTNATPKIAKVFFIAALLYRTSFVESRLLNHFIR